MPKAVPREADGLVEHCSGKVVLDELDLTVRSGSVLGLLGLLGPDGAGRTAFVPVLTTLVEPDEVGGRSHGQDSSRRHGMRRRTPGGAVA